MVRDGMPAGRWVAGAERPGGLCQVASTHILGLAQEGSAATTITRDCSGMEKGTSLNSASLAPKPVASSVYMRVPECSKGTFLIALVNCTIQSNLLSADWASCRNN